MTKTFVLVLLTLIANPAFAKTAKSYECISNGNPFVADKCTRTAKNDRSCSMEIMMSGSDSLVTSVFLDGVLNNNGSVANAYQVDYTKGGSISRHNVKFSHLNRGMIQLMNDKKDNIKGILGLEIYINKDSSGSHYTKYVCGSIR